MYLDNCCFNRPYDDQSKIRIRLEAEAKLSIQEEIRKGAFKLIWSYILEYENNKNPFRERRDQISKWRKYSTEDIVENQELLDLVGILRGHGIKKIDALHIASAIHAGADYFLTTDDGILKKAIFIGDIHVTNPIGFIKEVLT